jgi:hypothetical protein
MQIWVDADACPGEIKELLYRAAKRTQTKITLVANQGLRTPRSEFIDSILVPSGMNVADRRIVELVEPGELVWKPDGFKAAALPMTLFGSWRQRWPTSAALSSLAG